MVYKEDLPELFIMFTGDASKDNHSPRPAIRDASP